LFNYCIDLVLENALFSHPGVKIRQNVSLGDLEYADDFRILYDSEKDQTIIDDVVTLADRIGPKVITEKTKFMVTNHTDPYSLTVIQVQLDQVDSFSYLGSYFVLMDLQMPIFNSDSRKHKQFLLPSKNHWGTSVKLVYELKFESTCCLFEQPLLMNVKLDK